MTNEEKALIEALVRKAEAEHGVKSAHRVLAEAEEEVARCQMEQTRAQATRALDGAILASLSAAGGRH